MSSRLDRRCLDRCVEHALRNMLLNKDIDHEERIPLFARANQIDPDLPYLPLLKYVTFFQIPLYLTETLIGALMQMMISSN